MRLYQTYAFSVLTAAIMIGGALSLVREHKFAQAQTETIINTPFAGRIASTELCCNGLKITLAHPPLSVAYGTFIFPWTNMVPDPAIGLGLYSWWSMIPSETVLGSAIPGGVCITVASECESSEPTAFTIRQMGTTLVTGQ